MPITQQGPVSPEVFARMNEALTRLRERGALKDDRCPSCGTDQWEVDFLAIPAGPLPKQAVFYGVGGTPYLANMSGVSVSGYMPVLTLLCTNCGYTKIHNLNTLGLWKG